MLNDWYMNLISKLHFTRYKYKPVGDRMRNESLQKPETF